MEVAELLQLLAAFARYRGGGGPGVSMERYRSVEEMSAPKTASGEDVYRRVAEVWHTAKVLARRRYPHAVLRFRSIDEARAAREQWERENRPGREG